MLASLKKKLTGENPRPDDQGKRRKKGQAQKECEGSQVSVTCAAEVRTE